MKAHAFQNSNVSKHKLIDLTWQYSFRTWDESNGRKTWQTLPYNVHMFTVFTKRWNCNVYYTYSGCILFILSNRQDIVCSFTWSFDYACVHSNNLLITKSSLLVLSNYRLLALHPFRILKYPLHQVAPSHIYQPVSTHQLSEL